jgi:hypothetical protein
MGVVGTRKHASVPTQQQEIELFDSVFDGRILRVQCFASQTGQIGSILLVLVGNVSFEKEHFANDSKKSHHITRYPPGGKYFTTRKKGKKNSYVSEVIKKQMEFFRSSKNVYLWLNKFFKTTSNLPIPTSLSKWDKNEVIFHFIVQNDYFLQTNIFKSSVVRSKENCFPLPNYPA